MTAVETVKALKGQLELHIKNGDSTEILKAVQQFSKFDITKEILQSTMVGKTVWKLRRHAEAEIARISTELTDAWKAKAQAEAQTTPVAVAPVKGEPVAPAAAVKPSPAAAAAATATDSPKAELASPPSSQDEKEKSRKRSRDDDKASLKKEGSVSKSSKPETNGGGSAASSAASAASSASGETGAKAAFAPGEELRGKVVELLTQALGERTAEDWEDPSALAAEIEQELYKQFRGVTPDYKNKHRSISFNLKNPKNPELRQAVMRGMIPASKLVTMSPEEMASKELQEARQKMLDYQREAAKVGMGGGTQSDMFTCSKCGSNQTTYYQMQTRSSDEPMTTFHTCMKCGKRWKS